LKHISFEQIRR